MTGEAEMPKGREGPRVKFVCEGCAHLGKEQREDLIGGEILVTLVPHCTRYSIDVPFDMETPSDCPLIVLVKDATIVDRLKANQ